MINKKYELWCKNATKDADLINELKEIGKPFIVILNSAHPTLPETERMAEKLCSEYGVPVLPLSVEAMNEKEVYSVLRESLYEFPVTEEDLDVINTFFGKTIDISNLEEIQYTQNSKLVKHNGMWYRCKNW